MTVRSYDFDTGALLWEAGGLGENTIPQPVQHEDLIFAMSGHTVKMLMAIRLGRTGDLTGTDAIAWSTPRGASYTPSPLLHETRLYVLTDSGQLSAFDAATGKPLYQQARLPSRTTSRRLPSARTAGSISRPRTRMSSSSRWAIRFEVLATNTLKGSPSLPRR